MNSRAITAALLVIASSVQTWAQSLAPKAPSTTEPRWTADASTEFLPAENGWPTRWSRQGLAGPGLIVKRAATPARMSMIRLYRPLKPTDSDRSDVALLADRANPDEFSFEGPGSILFVESKEARRTAALNAGPSLAAGPDTGEVFVFVSAREQASKKLLDRTFFAYCPPSASRKADPAPPLRAVALLMPGLLGMPETTLDPLTRTLRSRGIGVLRMLCQPARFTERVEFSIDPKQPDAAATQIAACFDDRTAECAYAVQEAWAYLGVTRPEIRSLPRLAVGLSGGAMTLSTVVAREPGKYTAAILIGGGCDFWLINERSNYRTNVDSVRCVWKDAKPTEEQLQEFDRRYLAQARLDSFHTAPALQNVKTLLIHGEFDRAVPSELGDLLWQRLGKPERWSYPATHETLCGLLPTEFNKLTAWIEAALFGAPAPKAPTLEPASGK